MNILPIASGKGGVGKSAVSANLSIKLAQKGNKVVLCDFDFGGANLHTLLGFKNNQAGMGNFIYKQNNSLSELCQQTSVENLSFIAGDCLFPGTPNMDFFTKKKIMKELSSLDADYVILDLGGGTTYNILDFFLMTYNSVIVTSPELTSILNAYSFLKAAVFRFFTQQFPAKSEERKKIQEFLQSETSGTDASFIALVGYMMKEFPETVEKACKELDKLNPQVILNMGEKAEDLEMARRMRSLAYSKLNLHIDYIGFLHKDPSIPLAVAKRTPAILLEPNSLFSKDIDSTAQRILTYEYKISDIEMDDSDLLNLKSEYEARE